MKLRVFEANVCLALLPDFGRLVLIVTQMVGMIALEDFHIQMI